MYEESKMAIYGTLDSSLLFLMKLSKVIDKIVYQIN